MNFYSRRHLHSLLLLAVGCGSGESSLDRNRYVCVSTSSESLESDDSQLGLSPDEVVALIEEYLSTEENYYDTDGNVLWSESSTVSVEMTEGATMDTLQTGNADGEAVDYDWGDGDPICFEGVYGVASISVTITGEMVNTIDSMTGRVLWNGSTADDVWIDLEGYVEPNQHLLDEAQGYLDEMATKDVGDTGDWANCSRTDPEDLDYRVARTAWADKPLSKSSLSIGSSTDCSTFLLAAQADYGSGVNSP